VAAAGRGAAAEHADAAQDVVAAGDRADVDQAELASLGHAEARVAVPAVQGFPGREQLGGLELELLHRHVSGHGASLGRSPPDQAARGFTCPAPCGAGHGPGVRYLPNVLYGPPRTLPIPGQSMPASPD